MIDRLDHIVLAASLPDATVADCQAVLGRHADGLSVQLANTRLEVRAVAEGAADGLSELVFATSDGAKTERLLGQRALPVVAHADGTPRIAAAATHGVSIALVARTGTDATRPSRPIPGADEAGCVSGLDHVVIRSPNPERAVALYAGRLGLSLRLDRTEPAWGARLLFFRCGDLIVEVVHDLKSGLGDGPDRLWGLSWRVPDIARAHVRLRAAGVQVSDIRTGRRPGTQVFTVKSRTAGVPTLVLGPASS
jgi:catechol 2,3-dioxygenase-like lactoylglutathione lyase family enzyme